MIEHKYEIENTTDRGYVLWIDDKPSFCPFTPPVMVPGQIPGTASMMRMPCSTQCPLAETVEMSQGDESILKYVTACGRENNWKDVTEKQAPQQPQSGILKSL